MYRTDDPVADFGAWDAEMSAARAALPECDDCGERVTDDYYEIGHKIYCPECMETYRKFVVGF